MDSDLGLVEFVEKHGGRPKTAWGDSLPENLRQEILANPGVGARQICRWLAAQGYLGATESKIEHFRNTRTA
jgi:hypothetical protein